jgi:hypothetical protein
MVRLLSVKRYFPLKTILILCLGLFLLRNVHQKNHEEIAGENEKNSIGGYIEKVALNNIHVQYFTYLKI